MDKNCRFESFEGKHLKTQLLLGWSIMGSLLHPVQAPVSNGPVNDLNSRTLSRAGEGLSAMESDIYFEECSNRIFACLHKDI